MFNNYGLTSDIILEVDFGNFNSNISLDNLVANFVDDYIFNITISFPEL